MIEVFVCTQVYRVVSLQRSPRRRTSVLSLIILAIIHQFHENFSLLWIHSFPKWKCRHSCSYLYESHLHACLWGRRRYISYYESIRWPVQVHCKDAIITRRMAAMKKKRERPKTQDSTGTGNLKELNFGNILFLF